MPRYGTGHTNTGNLNLRYSCSINRVWGIVRLQFSLAANTARIMPVSASASPSGADPVSRTVVRSAANFQWGRQGYCPPPHWKLPHMMSSSWLARLTQTNPISETPNTKTHGNFVRTGHDRLLDSCLGCLIARTFGANLGSTRR